MKANATIWQEFWIQDYNILILGSELNDMLTERFNSEIGPVFIDVLKKYHEVVFKEPELEEQRDLCRQETTFRRMIKGAQLIRCLECQFWGREEDVSLDFDPRRPDHWCSRCNMYSKPDFFCAAARKVEHEDLREEEGK